MVSFDKTWVVTPDNFDCESSLADDVHRSALAQLDGEFPTVVTTETLLAAVT